MTGKRMKNMNTDEEERGNLSLFKKAYWQLEHQEADVMTQATGKKTNERIILRFIRTL